MVFLPVIWHNPLFDPGSLNETGNVEHAGSDFLLSLKVPQALVGRLAWWQSLKGVAGIFSPPLQLLLSANDPE